MYMVCLEVVFKNTFMFLRNKKKKENIFDNKKNRKYFSIFKNIK